MSKIVQWKRGNANVTSSYTGPVGEITINTDDWSLRVHDNVTPGGHVIEGGANIGNITVVDQTILGKNSNADIILDPVNASVVVANLSFASNAANATATATTLNGFALQITATTEEGGNDSSIYLWPNLGRMGFNTVSNAFDFNFNGYLSGTAYVASRNDPTGYSFYSPGDGYAGFSHVNGTPDYIRLSHNDIDSAKFYSNSTVELIGNLVVSSSGNVYGSFPNAFVQTYANVASYSQVINQNLSTDPLASTDFVVTADDGTDSSFFGDFGIASSTYSYPGFGLIKPHDVYLFVTGTDSVGPGSTGSGNLVIGSTNGNINFFVGAAEDANAIAQINSTGFIPSANVAYSLGSIDKQWKDLWVSNNTIYIGGVALGVSADGNLTVNGNVISGGGGGASTGNVTFSDTVVQGVSALQLSASPYDTSILKYLQVRAGDVDSHIHFDTGDNTTYDQYFGDDNKFVKLEAGDFGNVTIGTQNPGESYRWTFDNTGGTIYPTLSVQRGDNPSGTIQGQTLLFGNATQEAIISTPDGNDIDGINSQRLVINPGAGAPASSGEGGDIYLWAGRGGSASGSGGDIKIRGGQGGYAIDGGNGGDGGYIRMEAGDAAGIGGTPGYVQITGGIGGYGTPGVAGGFVTITGGQGQNGDGGLTTIQGGYGGTGYHGGNVQINGGGTSSGQSSEGSVNIQTGGHTWTFDPTGIVTLPDSTQMGAIEGTNTFGFYNSNANTEFLIELGSTSVWSFNGTSGITGLPNNTLKTGANLVIQTPSGVPASVANWNGGGGWNQGYYGNLATTGGTGTGLTVDVAAGGGGYINIGAISIHTPGTGYTDGDVITIDNENNIPGTFTISVAPNSWLFNSDGSTTFPDHHQVTITGNLTVGNLVVNGNSTIINTNSYVVSDNIITMADGNPADTLDLGFVAHRTVNSVLQHTGLVRDASVNNWKLFSNVIANPGSTVDFANAVYDDLVVGNVITSGNVDATFVRVNSGIISGLSASPAPIISGFGLISTTGLPGNISASGNLVASRDAIITGNVTAGNINGGNIAFTNNNNSLTFNTGAYISGNIVGREGSILLQPAATGTFQGVMIGGAGRILAPNQSVHIILNTSDVTLQVAQKITVGTAATSTTTGALQVSGGVGITGNAYIGGNIVVSANNNITTSGTGNITGNTGGFAIGYRDIPQVVFTSNATLALTDAGKHYFSSNSANVITVPNNATVSFSIGTAISIIQQGTANLTVTPGSGVTMYLAGNSTSSSRTVGNYGMATLMKVGSDTWFINGTGVN